MYIVILMKLRALHVGTKCLYSYCRKCFVFYEEVR